MILYLAPGTRRHLTVNSLLRCGRGHPACECDKRADPRTRVLIFPVIVNSTSPPLPVALGIQRILGLWLGRSELVSLVPSAGQLLGLLSWSALIIELVIAQKAAQGNQPRGPIALFFTINLGKGISNNPSPPSTQVVSPPFYSYAVH